MDDESLKAHLNALLDELKWFHSQRIGLRISPKSEGWNLSIITPTTLTDPFRDAKSWCDTMNRPKETCRCPDCGPCLVDFKGE